MELPEIKLRKPDGTEQAYVLQVCLINTKHPDGSPALCTFQEDHSIDLAGGEDFMACWVPKEMVVKT